MSTNSTDDNTNNENSFCKGVTKKGDPCKNRPMSGYEYCNWHQPLCTHQGSDGENCLNYANENGFCIFHSPDNEAESSTQQVSLIDFAQHDQVSRRDFLTLGWTKKYARKVAASMTSLPRPVQIIGGTLSAIVAEYLISDVLNYFKKTHDIEFLLPLTRSEAASSANIGEQLQSLESFQEQIGEGTTIVRLVNHKEKAVTAVIRYVDYNTGQTYSSPSVTLAPNYSYVDFPAPTPDGFFGGATVSSDTPLEARSIVKLEIINDRLDVRNSQFLDYKIPLSTIVPTEIENTISMVAVGRQGQLQRILDIPCMVKSDRIYFDRTTILDMIQATSASDALIIIQLEGRFIISTQTHDHAKEHMKGYSEDKAEVRFETTAEMISVTF